MISNAGNFEKGDKKIEKNGKERNIDKGKGKEVEKEKEMENEVEKEKERERERRRERERERMEKGNEEEKTKDKEERVESKSNNDRENLDSVYVRTNVPICDYKKEELVLNLEFSPTSIELILSNIRDKFIKNTEIRAFSCIENSVAISTARKLEFTEMLEERLRNHW